MDQYKIDSHKLIYHPERVAEWLKGGNIYPIFLDVSVTSVCNHSCFFCGLDYAHKNACSIKKEVMEKFVADAAKCGVKSIMYAGEGEPLLYKGFAEIVKFTKLRGIDVAVNSNGVYFTKDFSSKALRYITWARFSVDAGTPATYSLMHGARPGDFDTVLMNISDAVRVRNAQKLKTTVGTQFILLEENKDEVLSIAQRLKDLGVDYFIVKPYSKHPLSLNNVGTEINYSNMMHLADSLDKISTDTFKVIFRRGTMAKKCFAKPYDRCLGAPFWAYVSSKGDIYPCHTFLGDPKYSFGNINEASFKKIWTGTKRAKIVRYFNTKLDANKCRELCRLDNINTYLWELTHPHDHVNFI